MINMLQQKVSSLEMETILLLRGEACSLTYICAHFSEIQAFNSSSIAIACLIHTMECWNWTTVANRFIEIISVSLEEVDDSLKIDTPATASSSAVTDLLC
jgi:hypothetical protein